MTTPGDPMATIARTAVRTCIRAYQRFLSPLLPRTCRYYPTCSAYALQAVHRHGVVKGLGLGAWRLLRCNPLTDGGYDPVP